MRPLSPVAGWLPSIALFTLAFASTVNANERPNFLVIVVDDQSPLDLKIYNPDSPLDTPNIDRLAASGMVFDGAHHMGAW